MKAIRTRIRKAKAMDHGSLTPSSWQHMTDRWAREGTKPSGAWEVARAHDGGDLRKSGEVYRDYQDNMGIRKLGLAARALECVHRPSVGEARDLSTWRAQLSDARSRAHVMSQQKGGTYVVVSATGSRSVWGTNVQALDSVWVNGNKQLTEMN